MEQYTITEVTVRSLAAMLGVMMLAWGILVSLVWIVVGLAGAPFPGFAELLVVLVASPIAGAIIGAIGAIFFNLAAVFVGGLVITRD